MSSARKRRNAQAKARADRASRSKGGSLAEQSLTESRKANFWQRIAFVLGTIVILLTAVGVYFAIRADSSSQPNVTASASLGWVMTAQGGFTIAQHVSQMPKPMGASDAVIFDVTDRGGTGTRIESLTFKYNCEHDGRCTKDTFFQTSQVGQPGELTLPLYLQSDDSASLPVPLACDHGVFNLNKPTENVDVQAFVTLTGGEIISAGSVTIPGITAEAVQACQRRTRPTP